MNSFQITICRDSYMVCDPKQLLLLNKKHARRIFKLSKQYSDWEEHENNILCLLDALDRIKDEHKKFPSVVKKAEALFTEYKAI